MPRTGSQTLDSWNLAGPEGSRRALGRIADRLCQGRRRPQFWVPIVEATEESGLFGADAIWYAKSMTDRQSGRNCALNIIFDVFTEAAWQPGLESNRREAALAMKKVPETMVEMVEPFQKRLEGEPCPEPPFDSPLSKDTASDMDTAVSILVGALRRFVRGAGPGNWEWSEIAYDLVKRVEYEQRDKSQAFKQATADLVRPFHRVLSQSGHHHNADWTTGVGHATQ